MMALMLYELITETGLVHGSESATVVNATGRTWKQGPNKRKCKLHTVHIFNIHWFVSFKLFQLLGFVFVFSVLFCPPEFSSFPESCPVSLFALFCFSGFLFYFLCFSSLFVCTDVSFVPLIRSIVLLVSFSCLSLK